jgi:hypothetical protein
MPNTACLSIPNLPLRGDILIKCFHRTPANEKYTVFRCQFNTCAVHLHNNTDAEGDFFRQLTFAAAELDVICEGA